MAWIQARPLVGLSLAALLGLAGSAQAVSISSVVISTLPGNTANFLNNGTTDYRENRSSVGVLDTGGAAADALGNSVNAQTRYQAVVVSDAGIFTNISRSATSDYQITFTVSASTGNLYDLKIDTGRFGAVTLVNDGTASASASISAVTGSLNAVGQAGLGLAAGPSANSNSAVNSAISQTNTLTLTGLTGTQNITLRFTWSAATASTSGLTGGDEAAVRLGMAGTVSGSTADDYPGVGARTAANDGHFVTILATVTTPEPGTVALLGLGLTGLAVVGRRRA